MRAGALMVKAVCLLEIEIWTWTVCWNLEVLVWTIHFLLGHTFSGAHLFVQYTFVKWLTAVPTNDTFMDTGFFYMYGFLEFGFRLVMGRFWNLWSYLMEILFCRILWIKLFSLLYLIIWMHKLKCHVQSFLLDIVKDLGLGLCLLLLFFLSRRIKANPNYLVIFGLG